jgi:hypothetical protein
MMAGRKDRKLVNFEHFHLDGTSKPPHCWPRITLIAILAFQVSSRNQPALCSDLPRSRRQVWSRSNLFWYTFRYYIPEWLLKE